MKIKRFLSRLFASTIPAVLAAAPACAQAPATALPDADPAIWVTKDKDTTIYLFGTFHALDGKTDWFNDEVKDAFDKSGEVVVETITPEDPTVLQPLVMKYGLDMSGKTLTSKLSPEGQKNLAATLAGFGIPANAFDAFTPFFAAITIANLQYQKMGIVADKGVEKTLRTAAKDSNKGVGQLETIEYQLSLFNALPEAEQVRMLGDLLKESGKMEGEIAKMLASWNKGDADTLASMIQEMEGDSAALHKMLFVDRNQNWANWISKRMEQPGTVFLAVGAGHLAGENSVQSMLKTKGIESQRLPSN